MEVLSDVLPTILNIGLTFSKLQHQQQQQQQNSISGLPGSVPRLDFCHRIRTGTIPGLEQIRLRGEY